MIKTLFETALQQYDYLQGQIPTTIIHNRGTALTDGYLIVERVTPLVLPWTQSTSIESLSPGDRNLLNSIRNFFDFAFVDPSYIPLDLLPSNLGLRHDGTLVLLDFMEHREDDPHSFRCIARRRLESCSNGNTSIHLYLCDNLRNTNAGLYSRFTEHLLTQPSM